jgi:hypothetical protein
MKKVFLGLIIGFGILGYNENTGENIYQGLTSINKIVFGQNSVEVPSQAFANCTSLTDVMFDTGLIGVGDEAFLNCVNLTGKLKFSDKVTIIGQSAFENTNITAIEFGSRIEYILDRAFFGCPNLFDVNCSDTPDGAVLGDSVFSPEFYTEAEPGATPDEDVTIPEDDDEVMHD